MAPGRIRTFLLVVLINLIVLEVLSAVIVTAIGYVRPDLRLDLFLERHFAGIDDAYRQQYIDTVWHPLLGWDRRPMETTGGVNAAGETWEATFGADGARNDGQDYGNTLVATYGDSFTHGDEVNDTQTWQAHLEPLLGGDVKNYGVSAYGILQALLKLKGHMETGKVAPVTILTVYEGDLARVTTNFNPLLIPGTGVKLGFKPSLKVSGGDVEYSPNPYDDEAMTLAQLRDIAYEIAPSDGAMHRMLYISAGFPYTAQLWKVGMRMVDKVLAKWKHIDLYDTWATSMGQQLFEKIVTDFDDTCRHYGTRGVIMFIPDGETIRASARGMEPPYVEYTRPAFRERFPELVFIDVLQADFDAEKFNIKPYRGHTTDYGNRRIAAFLATRLTGGGGAQAQRKVF